MEDLPWDEIRSKIQENIKLEADSSARTIKILITGEMPEGTPIQDMMQGDANLKQLSGLFLGEEIEFAAEALEDGKGMLLRFEDDKGFKKMHEFLDGLFYGDILKELMTKIMEVMFEAFGEGNEPPS